MREQHKLNTFIKHIFFNRKIVNKISSQLYIKFILQNPRIFIPPIVGMIIEKIKRKRAGIDRPFYNCNINRDIKVIFDIGANIGDVTLAAVRSFPKAHIYSFEPVSATYKKLCENVSDYRERISSYNFGLFNVSKRLDIHISAFHGANSILEQSLDHKKVNTHIKEIGIENIEVRTLNSFVSSNNIHNIDIVKIDVEGVEKEVIEGGRETFKNNIDNVFIELSFLRRNRESTYWIEICKLLYDLGFVLINIYDVARYMENGKQYVAQADAFFAKQK